MRTVKTEKRKRVSKKNKIAWRKYAKVKDVEEFLEEQRLEERLGKPVSQKLDEELFQLDLKSSSLNTLSKQEKRSLLLSRPLRCFSQLNQQHMDTWSRKVNDTRNEKETVKKKIEKPLKSKDIQSLKDTKKNKIKSKLNSKDDIWDSQGLLKNGNLESDEWLDKSTIKNILRGSGKLRKSIPRTTRKKQTILSPIEIPHPGMSYNPSFEDHQALLQTIAKQEEGIIKEEKHLTRVTSDVFRKVSREENERDWLEEMSQGLETNSSPNNQESETEENGSISINPPVRNKKKNAKQRRKQREHQKLLFAQQLAKREKRKIADLYKVRQFEAEIRRLEKKSEHVQHKRQEKKKELLTQPKRVGSKKFEEPELEFTDPKDLTGNLRTFKKEGNLLLDRLKSLQKRNIIEPTSKEIRKKAKVKMFVKPGFKDDWKKTVARTPVKQKAYIS